MSRPFYYYARLDRVVDGDTIDVTLDLGFRTFCKQRLRLLGFDAPERKEPGFLECRDALQALMQHAKEILVHTVKQDSFGRWLSEVSVDGISVTDYMKVHIIEMNEINSSLP